MELPGSFAEKLTGLIGPEEYARYLNELAAPSTHALRANRLKLSPETLETLLADRVRLGERVPWCSDGYYFEIDPDNMPGRLAYYLAGLYYIQEPSAMYPAANARIVPGERVLDLCAAPGGKSLRAASDLGGRGLLVANDISESRAGTLLYNLELGGVANALVTNESPAKLRARFGAFFDVVLVDAPCSGEGMFRKDPEALKSYEQFKTEVCAGMQREILASAAGLIRPGGRLMYSTCTFDRGENEAMVEEFLTAHPEFELCALPKPGGVADGFASGTFSGLERTARLWPQRLRGEGQFAALMVKTEEARDDCTSEELQGRKCRSFRRLRQYPEELRVFAEKNLTFRPFEDAAFCVMGETLYAFPFEPVDIDQLKVLRMGVCIGELSYGKLRPAQQFIMCLPADAFLRRYDVDPFGTEVKKYLRGESLSQAAAPDGFCAVTVAGYQLGGGEVRNGTLKNLYPKGWRRFL